MSKTVIGVFDHTDQAEKAADELQRRGFHREEISIVTKEGGRRGGDRGGDDTDSLTGSDVGGGVATGGAIGGAAGLLAGVGALAIPGIGPVIAAGPIAAALSGAVTGGLAGGLIDWGIPEESGRRFEEEVKSGKVVAMVKADDHKVREAENIFRRHGAKEVESH